MSDLTEEQRALLARVMRAYLIIATAEERKPVEDMVRKCCDTRLKAVA